MKKSLILASLTIGSLSLFALDKQYFIGSGIERSSADVKGTFNVPNFGIREDISDTLWATTLKIKTGIIFDEIHRISLSYAKYEESESNLSLGLINYDYLMSITKEFKIYTGVHLGKGKVDFVGEILGNQKESGLVYGPQVGMLYDITKHIELELGLDYTIYDNIDKTVSGLNAGIPFDAKGELDNSKSLFVGINYKF